MIKSFGHIHGGPCVPSWILLTLVLTAVVKVCNGESEKDDPRLKAPWVASIFYRNPGNGLWEYVCGGTITSSSTVITSARCILPRITQEKLSSRPYHYNYKNLQVVAGLKTNNFDSKDQFTQYGEVGQIRDLFAFTENSDTPHKDLAAIRLKNKFNTSTHYVKDVMLTQYAQTILEANSTKPGNSVIIAGFDLDSSSTGVQTRSKIVQSLKVSEIQLTDIASCIERYTNSYDAYYFDILCGKSPSAKELIPCYLQGAGMVIKVNSSPKSNAEEGYFLMGVYSSNSALAKTEGSLRVKNEIKPEDCSPTDFIFFTRLGYLERWGISHEFCGYDLATCLNNKCRPWKDLCDGVSQCDDRSDETPEMCFNQGPCSPNQFKCKYGACIDKSKTCNGVQDCMDGSDEDPQGICKPKVNVVDGDAMAPIRKVVAGCSGIPERKDVEVRCTHPDREDIFTCNSQTVPVGTNAILKRNEVKATCTRDGVWSRSVDIQC